MRQKKTEMMGVNDRHDIVFIQDSSKNQGLVKANRFLLLLASSLMLLVFLMGFFLVPDGVRDGFKANNQAMSSISYATQNPVLSDEINALKGQLVGLISGSIEGKLRVLEDSVRSGSITDSLGTIQDLRSDLKVLKIYSKSEKVEIKNQVNEKVLKEVSQLKNLIYLTLTSCGLMVAAIGGFWIRRHYHLGQFASIHRLGKSE